jgi:LacI family transcriptional regulator
VVNIQTKSRTNGGVTLFDVARLAGVHPSTVSRALDPRQHTRVKNGTRKRIMEAANRLGYRPDLVARGLQSGRTAAIGVIAADLGNLFVTPIIHGLTTSIEAAGMLPMIAETQDDHHRFSRILDHLLARRVDAMVVMAARTGDVAILEKAAISVPVVIAARPLDGTLLTQVMHDDLEGGRMVAEHLHLLGHTRVAQLRGPIEVMNFPRRAAGFGSYCQQAGMSEVAIDVWAESPTIEEGARLTQMLLDTHPRRPTAIFAHNDFMALGALGVLGAAGLRVPEDVSLVGYNDLPMVGYLSPPLTTVHYPSLEIGHTAGLVVEQLLAGEQPTDHNLDPRLVVRGSTGRV